MVSRFFEVTRYNAIVTRYGRVTLPKNFLSSGRVALPNTRGTRFRDFFRYRAVGIAICNEFGIAFLQYRVITVFFLEFTSKFYQTRAVAERDVTEHTGTVSYTGNTFPKCHIFSDFFIFPIKYLGLKAGFYNCRMTARCPYMLIYATRLKMRGRGLSPLGATSASKSVIINTSAR